MDYPWNLEEGKWGEEMAVNFLVAKGYCLVERNWRLGHYEVDIVMQKGNRLVFVEVKTRTDADHDPVEAVDKKKRQRIITAADAFIRYYKVQLEYQFDIVSITGRAPDHKIEHFPDAFFPALKKHNFTFKM